MSCSTRMRNVIAFLRAGYPADFAPAGHIALLALCPRRITDAEITNMELPTLEQIALVRPRVNAGAG
jgi:hypothetical protein